MTLPHEMSACQCGYASTRELLAECAGPEREMFESVNTKCSVMFNKLSGNYLFPQNILV